MKQAAAASREDAAAQPPGPDGRVVGPNAALEAPCCVAACPHVPADPKAPVQIQIGGRPAARIRLRTTTEAQGMVDAE